MSEIFYIGGFLAGFLVLGPLLAWLAGLFNPIGWMGVLPWRVPAEVKEEARRRGW